MQKESPVAFPERTALRVRSTNERLPLIKPDCSDCGSVIDGMTVDVSGKTYRKICLVIPFRDAFTRAEQPMLVNRRGTYNEQAAHGPKDAAGAFCVVCYLPVKHVVHGSVAFCMRYAEAQCRPYPNFADQPEERNDAA
jgi:hypothetical protein